MTRNRLPLFRTAARGGPPAALVLALLAGPVVAAPGDDPANGGLPDAGQITRAQADVHDKTAAVDRIQGELDRARTDLDRLAVEAARAVEAYNGAQVRARQAAVAADEAQARVAAAGVAVERARDDLGRSAAESYRFDGGSRLGALSVLLGSSSPADAALRSETLRHLMRGREEALRHSGEAARQADRARRDADTAAHTTRQAADAVRAAQHTAAAMVAEQQQRVSEFTGHQDQLVEQLAVARSTSVELERQRQEGLAELARRSAEDEARRRAEEQARGQGSVQARPGLPDASSSGTGGPAERPGRAAVAIAYAKAQLGKPYVWGGEGPHGFDCSGLVMQAWRRAGVELTHFAATQYAESRPVSYPELRPGDLIFWTETPRPEDIHHVGMYLGDGLMIHAPRTGDVIRVSSMFYMGTPDFYARP